MMTRMTTEGGDDADDDVKKAEANYDDHCSVVVVIELPPFLWSHGPLV